MKHSKQRAKTKSLTRIAATGATVLALGGASLVAATTAHAATQLGTLTFTPASGVSGNAIRMSTVSTGASLGCPIGDTSGLSSSIVGPAGSGAWTTGSIAPVGFNTADLNTGSAEITVPWEDTFASYATVNGAPLVPGKYDVTLLCVNAAGTDYSGQFTGSIWFTTTNAWQTTDPNA